MATQLSNHKLLVKLRGDVVKSSRLYGFSLGSDAVRYLSEVLLDLNETERNEAAQQIWSTLSKQKLTNKGAISRQQCERAVLECTGQDTDGSIKLLEVVSAFDVPKFVCDPDKQKFTKVDKVTLPTTCEDFCSYFRNRFNTIYQRLLRNPLFSERHLHSSTNPSLETSHKFKLKSLEALFGSNILHENITVFGMISQLKPNAWYLEDLNGAVELDLTQAEYRPGLVCDNTFVLCEGDYENDLFRVRGVSLPPTEDVSVTRAQYGDTNFFGGDLTTCPAANKTLQKKLHESQESFIVILSNVHLDDSEVMKKLDILFKGYSESPPTAFILCGPFLSSETYKDPYSTLTGQFKALANLVSIYDSLKDQTHFIFVPALSDLGGLSVYPRAALPNSVTAAFTKQVKFATFTTNPCRIRYCTREIVVFREELVKGMFRCRMNSPRENLSNHFVRTLLSNSSLALLPMSTMPVIWTYDQAMSLYPLPDLVVTADTYYPFTESHSGCTVINPGSFPQNKFSFKVYYPITNEVEDSEIPRG